VAKRVSEKRRFNPPNPVKKRMRVTPVGEATPTGGFLPKERTKQGD
jgi:hypothetical protein